MDGRETVAAVARGAGSGCYIRLYNVKGTHLDLSILFFGQTASLKIIKAQKLQKIFSTQQPKKTCCAEGIIIIIIIIGLYDKQ